jgi:hypothetical protein
MDRIQLYTLGVHLKKIIILIAVALCCAALSSGALAADKAAANPLTVLKQDSGMNLSEMNLTMYSAIDDFGISGLGVGEAVKFTAPKSGWKLKGVQILGWSGFNNTTKTFPADRNFLIEIRDKDLNLLYKYADAQNMYFISTTGPIMSGIEIPSIALTGDFYVLFYDRGALGIAMENGKGTGNSFFFLNGQMAPAEFKLTKNNETAKINWIIRAVGE